ncbi:hypothetical protein [Methylosinus sp. Ce-a6]|uniref:hypothetical protein n=1 Tax=Methylosinus sp. Ce-a6 TaxID=2172005 RepID=UPI00135930B6|nr:hypothetical protein [Methylosinus sp. Ce-a6]
MRCAVIEEAQSSSTAAAQPKNAAKLARAAACRRTRIDENLAIQPDKQDNILAGGNASARRQRLQLTNVDVPRIAAESLLKIGHEVFCGLRIQVAPFRQRILLGVR